MQRHSVKLFKSLCLQSGPDLVPVVSRLHDARKSPPLLSHSLISAARKSRKYSRLATMWIGKTALRSGLKSTGSLMARRLANRLNGFWIRIVVVLICLTFISALLLSSFICMTNDADQSGHVCVGRAPGGVLPVNPSTLRYW